MGACPISEAPSFMAVDEAPVSNDVQAGVVGIIQSFLRRKKLLGRQLPGQEAAGVANLVVPLRKRCRTSVLKRAKVSLAVDYVLPIRPTKLLTNLDTHPCQRARSGEPGLVLQSLVESIRLCFRMPEVFSGSGSKSLSGFWPFLMFWAFKVLECCRPLVKDNVQGIPRARCWIPSNVLRGSTYTLDGLRAQLVSVPLAKMSPFPYAGLQDEHLRELWERGTRRWALRGLYSWEVYMGERSWYFRVLKDPSIQLFGERGEVPPDFSGEGDEANLIVGETDYHSWFRGISVGHLVPTQVMVGGSRYSGPVLRGTVIATGAETHAIERGAAPAPEVGVVQAPQEGQRLRWRTSIFG